MCGISGIVCLKNETEINLRQKIDAMNKITKHRGPDSTDSVVTNCSALGVNRLAITGIDDDSAIYTTSAKAPDVIYTGEIANAIDIEKKYSLTLDGRTCDGAILAPLFEQIGTSFVKELAGMYAIAIYDRHQHELHLFRDPSGIKPLYYYVSDEIVYFASEIKAIQAVLDEPVTIDLNAVSNIIRYRFNVGVKTVFPAIKRVLPGEHVKITKGQIKKYYYFSPALRKNDAIDSKNKDGLPPISYLRDTLHNVIMENTRAEVNGGVFVSGGLDSSAIASIVAKHNTPFKTHISINFEHQTVNDEMYAHYLENYLETKFEWVTISPENARTTLEELVLHLDEPLENPTHVGTYMMAKRASELGIKTVLTGDGADEYFLGYERFRPLFGKQVANSFKKYANQLWSLDPLLFEELYTEKARLLMDSLTEQCNQTMKPITSIQEALILEQGDRLPEYHCMRLDRMTMAWGVEARVPFLDRRITQLANQIPPAIRYGQHGKDWLKKAVSPFLPQSIIQRKKDFFPSLPAHWIRAGGIDWASEILLSEGAEISRFFNQKVLENWLELHKNHKQDYGRTLWACIVLELWLGVQASRFQSKISHQIISGI